jgi:hypothetical protein
MDWTSLEVNTSFSWVKECQTFNYSPFISFYHNNPYSCSKLYQPPIRCEKKNNRRSASSDLQQPLRCGILPGIHFGVTR